MLSFFIFLGNILFAAFWCGYVFGGRNAARKIGYQIGEWRDAYTREANKVTECNARLSHMQTVCSQYQASNRALIASLRRASGVEEEITPPGVMMN